MPSALRQPVAGDQGLHTVNDHIRLLVAFSKERPPCFLGIGFGNLPKKTLSHKPFSKITFIDIAKSRKIMKTYWTREEYFFNQCVFSIAVT